MLLEMVKAMVSKTSDGVFVWRVQDPEFYAQHHMW